MLRAEVPPRQRGCAQICGEVVVVVWHCRLHHRGGNRARRMDKVEEQRVGVLRNVVLLKRAAGVKVPCLSPRHCGPCWQRRRFYAPHAPAPTGLQVAHADCGHALRHCLYKHSDVWHLATDCMRMSACTAPAGPDVTCAPLVHGGIAQAEGTMVVRGTHTTALLGSVRLH